MTGITEQITQQD